MMRDLKNGAPLTERENALKNTRFICALHSRNAGQSLIQFI